MSGETQARRRKDKSKKQKDSVSDEGTGDEEVKEHSEQGSSCLSLLVMMVLLAGIGVLLGLIYVQSQGIAHVDTPASPRAAPQVETVVETIIQETPPPSDDQVESRPADQPEGEPVPEVVEQVIEEHVVYVDAPPPEGEQHVVYVDAPPEGIQLEGSEPQLAEQYVQREPAPAAGQPVVMQEKEVRVRQVVKQMTDADGNVREEVVSEEVLEDGAEEPVTDQADEPEQQQQPEPEQQQEPEPEQQQEPEQESPQPTDDGVEVTPPAEDTAPPPQEEEEAAVEVEDELPPQQEEEEEEVAIPAVKEPVVPQKPAAEPAGAAAHSSRVPVDTKHDQPVEKAASQEKAKEPVKVNKPKEPVKEEKPKEPAKEDKPKESVEEKVKEPVKEEKPIKEEKPKEPAKVEKPKEPVKQEKSEEPVKQEKPEEPVKAEKLKEPVKQGKPEEPVQIEKPKESAKKPEPEKEKTPEKPAEKPLKSEKPPQEEKTKPTEAPVKKEAPTEKPKKADSPTEKPVQKDEPTEKPEEKKAPTEKPIKKEATTEKPVAKEVPTAKPAPKTGAKEEAEIKRVQAGKKDPAKDPDISDKAAADKPASKTPDARAESSAKRDTDKHAKQPKAAPAADEGIVADIEEEPSLDAAEYEKAEVTGPEDWDIRDELDTADNMVDTDAAAALNAFGAILSRRPRSPRALWGRARALNAQAEQERSNNLLDRAIKAFRDVLDLDLDPETPVPLSLYRQAAETCVQQMRFRGQTEQAARIQQRLIQKFPDDYQLRNHLATVFLTYGQNNAAEEVLQEVLRLWPSNGYAKAHLGFIRRQQGRHEEATQLMQQGLDSDEPGVHDKRFYYNLGDSYDRIGQRDLALKTYEEGVRRGLLLSTLQRSLINVDRLTGRPFWTAEQTGSVELIRELEANYQTIRGEMLSLLASDRPEDGFQPEQEQLSKTGDWKQYTMFKRGRKNQYACVKTPRTCELIERFPEAAGCRRGQVKFSMLSPGTTIWPHTGPTNCRLRLHLGLKVPSGTGIRVAGEERSWEEGKVMVIDDSFEHDVWNDGDQPRFILIVDIWHPELTDEEKRSIPSI